MGREGVLNLDEAFHIYCDFLTSIIKKQQASQKMEGERGAILQRDNENSQKAFKNGWISQT